MALDTSKPRSVYAVRCKANGKMYIGSSVDPETRMRTHFSEARYKIRNGIENCYNGSTQETKDRTIAFTKDFEKYGEKGFELYIIEKDLPFDESFEREQYYTLLYRTNEMEYGYNRAAGRRIFTSRGYTVINGLPPKKD